MPVNVETVKKLIHCAYINLRAAEEIDPRLLKDFKFETAKKSIGQLIQDLGPLKQSPAIKIDGLFRRK